MAPPGTRHLLLSHSVLKKKEANNKTRIFTLWMRARLLCPKQAREGLNDNRGSTWST